MGAVYFHPVRTGLLCPDCGVAEFVDDLPYTFIGHGFGNEIEHGTGYFGRSLRHLVKDIGRYALAAGVVKLDDYFRAFFMDSIHQL